MKWRKEQEGGTRRSGLSASRGERERRRYFSLLSFLPCSPFSPLFSRCFFLPASSDLSLSAHYACTHCQKSFEPPSPQLFSFNSPQGMCPECSGLGQIYSFDPEQLIPDSSRSLQQGCIELLGSWKDLGRWKRHIFRGVAEQRWNEILGFPPSTVLETACRKNSMNACGDGLLWGTGDEHITFTWRGGTSGYKWGGPFEGIIPKLLAQYRNTRSRPQRRQLESNTCADHRLLRPTLRAGDNAQGVFAGDHYHGGDFHCASPPEQSLPGVCQLAVSDASEFFSALELDAMVPHARSPPRPSSEIRQPAAIPQERRPGIPGPGSHRADAFRRRNAQRITAWHGQDLAGAGLVGVLAVHSRRAVDHLDILAITTSCWKRSLSSATRAIPW